MSDLEREMLREINRDFLVSVSKVHRVYWTAIGVPDWPGPGQKYEASQQYAFQAHPRTLFRGIYLIVTTPGWFIVKALVGNQPFLENVDGDAYSRSEHDRIERAGQLERHKLKMDTAQIGNLITFFVKPHYPKLESERPFTAVIIGVAAETC